VLSAQREPMILRLRPAALTGAPRQWRGDRGGSRGVGLILRRIVASRACRADRTTGPQEMGLSAQIRVMQRFRQPITAAESARCSVQPVASQQIVRAGAALQYLRETAQGRYINSSTQLSHAV